MAGMLVINLERWHREADSDLRLQATSRAFYASKWILCDKNVSLNSRIDFFESVVTSVVRFGAGQRKLYKSEFRKLDVHWRKLLRQVAGPPGSIDWTQPWHSIWHQRNQRVAEQMQLNGFELWSNRCVLDYWKFVQYVAVLDDSRWPQRALKWNAGGGRRGRSFDLSDAPVTKLWGFSLQPRTKLSSYSTCRTLSHLCICNIFVRSHPLCPKWVAAPRHTGAKSKLRSGCTNAKLQLERNGFKLWTCRFLAEY